MLPGARSVKRRPWGPAPRRGRPLDPYRPSPSLRGTLREGDTDPAARPAAPARVDALAGESGERLAAMTGAVLDPTADPALQAIVEEAAAALRVPIALVSLVLEKTQFFRAHTGLSGELAATRATDRDVSFCQFVVRDERRLEVGDAAHDARVPQLLVDRYGVAAYIGEPVRVGGVVVGSLCGIDTRERTFTDEERSRLAGLAARASARLEELARQARRASPELLAEATAPAFAELRNVLMPLAANLQVARLAVAELAPLERLVGFLDDERAGALAGLAGKARSGGALADLRDVLDALDECRRRIEHGVLSVERLVAEGAQGGTAAEVIDVATRLAHHHLKIHGGVSWAPVAPDLRFALPAMVVGSVLAAALSQLAGLGRAPVEGRVEAEGDRIRLLLRSGDLDEAAMDACVGRLKALVGPQPFLALGARGRALCIEAQGHRASHV